MNITSIQAGQELARRKANKAGKGNPEHKYIAPESDEIRNTPAKALRALTSPAPTSPATLVVVPEPAVVVATSAPVSPTKGVSRYGLTPEQVTLRDALFTEHGKGQAYHDACFAAGIPTKKNGLLVTA